MGADELGIHPIDFSSGSGFGVMDAGSLVPAMVLPCHGRKKVTRPSDVEGSTRPMLAGQDGVDSRDWGDDGLAVMVIHLTERVGEGPRAVDDEFGPDADFMRRRRMAVSGRPHVLPQSFTLASLQARDPRVVHDAGAMQGGCHADGYGYAEVVVGAGEVGPLQHGERLESLAPHQGVGALDALIAGKEVVAFGPQPVVRGLAPPVDGEQDTCVP